MQHQSQLAIIATEHRMRVKDFCKYLTRKEMALGSARRKFKKELGRSFKQRAQ